MCKIRFIRDTDIKFIKESLINYGVFFSDYVDSVISVLLQFNGTLSSTLITENNNDIIGLDINLLQPYTFWNEVYKKLSFFKKIKWTYSNITSNKQVQLNNDTENIYTQLYQKDSNIAYTLFYMFKKIPNRTISAADVGILQLKLIFDTHKYQTAEIVVANQASIKSYNTRGFNITTYKEYEKDVMFAVIQIDEIKDKIKNHQINCEIIL